jgi:uncharacterized protein (DUF58 family)
MDERARMWVMVGISAVLLAIALMITLNEGINAWSEIVLLTILAIALVAIALAAKSMREIRSGFPLQDERSMALSIRAGNRAFYVSMYIFLFMAMAFVVLEDRGVTFSNAELLFVIVGLMGSIHIIFSVYYNRKGRRSSE